MNKVILRVESIRKQFDRHTAVADLSFAVSQGEVFALLGPNGAGKTTTIRMLLDIIQPDSGTVTFSLDNTDSKPSPRQIGYLPEERGLYRDIPVLRTLTYMGVLRGLARKDAESQGRFWLERVGLADRAGDKLETLSKGNQQKVQFVSAILHRPEFAILDEPFSGLDPINQNFFLDVVRDLRDQGTTILLCAHQMELVERLADRVLLLSQGREILHGTLTEISDSAAASNKIVVRLKETTDLSVLRSAAGVDRIEELSANEYAIHVRKSEPVHKLLVHIASSLEPLDIRTEKVSLHDIFVRAVSDSTAGDRKEQQS